ncbi:MAG: BamA/TamA family outer membrane protein [Chitinophagaceae bacterium]
MHFKNFFFLLLFILPLYGSAQIVDSSTAAGSKPFKTNGSKNFWMGSNYRKEWNTTVRVPVINLSTEYGGLTPVKRGGGKQTRSLRLEDPNGREYSLRSVQKFITSKTLPGDLQSEAAADLVADGVSASYPYANLSNGVFSEAAGVPYGKIRLVYVGDDPKLGEYRKDFANMLALLETRLPDSVKKGYDTDDVADKLKEDNDNETDQQALLRARILDMYVMDLDRHEDQWQWGAVEKDKGKLYYPIPRDRDQAFYINRGVLPGMIKWPWLVPQLQGFDAKAKNIKRFNFAARNLDRFFLNELTEEDWKQAVDKFIPQMTDDVIEKALNQQPPEIKPISAPQIIQKLKERRNYLAAEVMSYYRFLAEYVDVTASDKKELFDITINDDGYVQLQIFKITKEGDQSTKMYERKFDPSVTKELRLYGFGGDDKFVVHGKQDKIKIRLIGGEGSDEFVNTGKSGKIAIVYDLKSEDNKLTGEFRNKMKNDTMSNYYQRIYYKYNQVIPFLSAGYNGDDGLFLGGWLKIVNHGFRKDPYKNAHTITFNQAFATGATNFKYNAEFIGTFGRKSDLVFDADIKAPSTTTNFFGYGMSTFYDKTKPGKFRYYRARYRLGDISLLLRKNFSKQVIMTIGPTYQFYKLDQDDKFNQVRYITMTGLNGLDPATLYANQSYVGGKLSIMADTRDNPIMPQKGVLWNTSLRHLSGLSDTKYKVTQLNSDLTFYIKLIKDRLVIADRVGAGHNFGDYEFYQAQYLGSEDNLRGYRKYRFAGRSKMYNNFEMRLRLANFKTYLFPGSLGLLGFYDIGHISDDNDSSTKWASGYGGGFWISPLRRMVLTFSYTASKEDKLPLISLGWKF